MQQAQLTAVMQCLTFRISMVIIKEVLVYSLLKSGRKDTLSLFGMHLLRTAYRVSNVISSAHW
jgi:hypothetical protein